MNTSLEPPPILDSAPVILYAESGGATTYTSHHVTYVNGKQVDPSPQLAICENLVEDSFLLMKCDNSWNVLAASFHSSIEVAKAHAEETYLGTSANWLKPRALTGQEFREIADLRQRLRTAAAEYSIDGDTDTA